ncbi:hypothetical protein AAH991_39510 [Microbispora sp. ZYX-F-249]|uniref:Flotillin family protein n=1 Tax=Microbispora maris TaxID=3144104 RepID=A0ABV0B3V6_9ACTN
MVIPIALLGAAFLLLLTFPQIYRLAIRFATRVGGAFLTHPTAWAGGDTGTVGVIVTGRAPSFLPIGQWTVSEVSRASAERFIPADRP